MGKTISVENVLKNSYWAIKIYVKTYITLFALKYISWNNKGENLKTFNNNYLLFQNLLKDN